MQTNFAPELLAADPRMTSSEKIVRTCVHCGFCTATCPTYLLLGDELDSPRGRIYLMKDMLEGNKPATAEVVTHIDRCLSCLACMTTCPSGVHYMHLVDHARAHIEETYTRPPADRALRALLAFVLPHPARFRAALVAARLGRPFRPLVARLPGVGARLAAMLDLAPKAPPPSGGPAAGEVYPAQGPRKGRVALLRGCAQSVLDPDINAAAIRFLTRHGVEVVLAREEGCCGALEHHMGREAASHHAAKRNVDAWTREIEGGGLDAILVTTSGCGTTVKDYGFMLREDASHAAKAARVSSLAKDWTEFAATLDWAPTRTPRKSGAGVDGRAPTLAYHSACSMQHGQQIRDEPKALLRRAGFAVKDPAEPHICCGSAGTYNILQPELAGRLRERKTKNLLRTKADLIATGNIGCIAQIGRGLGDTAPAGAPPILHTVKLLDWLTGGPRPAELDGAGLEAVETEAPRAVALADG